MSEGEGSLSCPSPLGLRIVYPDPRRFSPECLLASTQGEASSKVCGEARFDTEARDFGLPSRDFGDDSEVEHMCSILEIDFGDGGTVASHDEANSYTHCVSFLGLAAGEIRG